MLNLMYIFPQNSFKNMKNYYLSFLGLLFILFPFIGLQAQEMSKTQQKIVDKMDKSMDQYAEIASEIWNFSELGFLEEKSTALLQAELKKAGFEIETGVAGMPTSFIASYGSGSPVIAFLAEYDVLPDMSQVAEPQKGAASGCTAGHACGHHLFGTGSLAAAIHVKNWLERTKTLGTIRLYGTPAEEELVKRRGVDFIYESLLGDREPPLDYMKGNQ